MEANIKLVLVDDEILFLRGMQTMLSRVEGLEVLHTANDGQALLNWLEEASVFPDLILMDLRMEPMNGIDTTQRLKELYPELRVAILSTYYREAFLGYMVKLGVSAFLPKNMEPDHLVAAIRKVHEKGLYLTDEHVVSLQQQMMSNQKFPAPTLQKKVQLTNRESEILRLICDQFTNAEIAERLFVSIRTVEGHRNNIMQKTGVKNTVGLVMYALLNNVVDVNEKLVDFTVN